jgi:hypothetical protein
LSSTSWSGNASFGRERRFDADPREPISWQPRKIEKMGSSMVLTHIVRGTDERRSDAHRRRNGSSARDRLAGVDTDFDPGTEPLLVIAPGKARRAPDGPRGDRPAPAWSPMAPIRAANPPNGYRPLRNVGYRRAEPRSHDHGIGLVHRNSCESGSREESGND